MTNLPDKIFGIDVESAYKKILSEKNPEKPPKNPKPETPKIDATISSPAKYLILPGQTHGSYSYPDLLVAAETTYQNKNWNQVHEELKKEDSFMLNPRQFADFLKLLKSGNAFDGNKNKVDSKELEQILKDILEIRNPWRSEWLDHKYSSKSKGLFKGSQLCVTYHKFDSSGKLVEVTEDLDSDTLMEDKTPRIHLEEWINNSNNQGLPRSRISDGGLYYWKPTEGRVAGFRACAGGVNLGCDRDPLGSNSGLGVRHAKIFGGHK